MTPERFIALTRDVLCMTVSVLGIAWQAHTGVIHAELLTLYMGLLTWSGTANLISARPRRSGGLGSSWSSPPSDSPPPSPRPSTSSSTVGGDPS